MQELSTLNSKAVWGNMKEKKREKKRMRERRMSGYMRRCTCEDAHVCGCEDAHIGARTDVKMRRCAVKTRRSGYAQV